MGNCVLKIDTDEEAILYNNINISHFTTLNTIGRGGFGRVHKAVHRSKRELVAIKHMSKHRIIAKRSINSVLNEQKLLSVLRHPFLVNMKYAFQSEDSLYLVMDYLSGGDLRYYMQTHTHFTEDQAKFLCACLLTGLEYIHSNKILHRDIKPENIIFDSKGYIRITDLGIARRYMRENYMDTSGTPGYMAPEVLCRQNYTYAIDFYALGIILYECMNGRRPYLGASRAQIKEGVLTKEVQLKRQDIPQGWSSSSADFINKLILRNQEARLGFQGIQQIKNHAWLRDFNWPDLISKRMNSPFEIPAGDNYNAIFARMDWKDNVVPQPLSKSIQEVFANYYFDYRLQKEATNNPSTESSELKK